MPPEQNAPSGTSAIIRRDRVAEQRATSSASTASSIAGERRRRRLGAAHAQ